MQNKSRDSLILDFLRPYSGQPLSSKDVQDIPPPIFEVLFQLASLCLDSCICGQQNQDWKTELASAKDKTKKLSSSLSQLSQSFATLTTKHVATQRKLTTVTNQLERQIERWNDERDGLRALGLLWENRWKEERREREELSKLGISSLNTPTIIGKLSLSSNVHALHRGRSDSKSSLTTIRKASRDRANQVIVDLSREIQKSRQTFSTTLSNKDNEINTLRFDLGDCKQELRILHKTLESIVVQGSVVSFPEPMQGNSSTLASQYNTDEQSAIIAQLEDEVRVLEHNIKGKTISAPPDNDLIRILTNQVRELERKNIQFKEQVDSAIQDRDAYISKIKERSEYPTRDLERLEAEIQRLKAQLIATENQLADAEAGITQQEADYDRVSSTAKQTLSKKIQRIQELVSLNEHLSHQITQLEDRIALISQEGDQQESMIDQLGKALHNSEERYEEIEARLRTTLAQIASFESQINEFKTRDCQWDQSVREYERKLDAERDKRKKLQRFLKDSLSGGVSADMERAISDQDALRSNDKRTDHRSNDWKSD